MPGWEVSGFLGHKQGGITERYAKFAPDYLGQAAQAIDESFRELQPHVERDLSLNVIPLRTTCAPLQKGGDSQVIEKLERLNGFEPSTCTLATCMERVV